jgi:hypothetical protein
LDVDDRALDHALEAAVGLASSPVAAIHDEARQLLIDVARQVDPELVDIDLAGPHHVTRVLVLREGQQQVLQRGVLVIAFGCERERFFKSRFERLGKTGQGMKPFRRSSWEGSSLVIWGV